MSRKYREDTITNICQEDCSFWRVQGKTNFVVFSSFCIPWLQFQSQQYSILLFLSVPVLPFSPDFDPHVYSQNPYDYIRPTQIIQNNLPISSSHVQNPFIHGISLLSFLEGHYSSNHCHDILSFFFFFWSWSPHYNLAEIVFYRRTFGKFMFFIRRWAISKALEAEMRS